MCFYLLPKRVHACKDFRRRRNCNRLASAASCPTMVLHCPVGSVKYLIQLLKSAKCSSLTIEHGLIKVNVIELIEVGYCLLRRNTVKVSCFQTIRPLHPSQIPQELCLAMDGHYGGFYSEELDVSFDFLNLKVSAVLMAPANDNEDGTGEDMHYRYLFPVDMDGLALETTIGLRVRQLQNGQPDVFVRKFEYRFVRDVPNVRARAKIG